MRTDEPSAVIQESSIVAQPVRGAQDEAARKNAAKRQAERQAKMTAWGDPDAMKARDLLTKRVSLLSLLSMRAKGQESYKPDLPPAAELPPEMRNQQPSTIRAWMRGENPVQWREGEKKHRELTQNQLAKFKMFPEALGCDDSSDRASLDVFNSLHAVMTGKSIKLSSVIKRVPEIAAETTTQKLARFMRMLGFE